MKEKYPTAPPAKTVEESAPSTDASTDPSSGSHSHSLFSNSSTNSTASFREAALKTRQLMPRVDRVFPVLIQFEITLDWKISAIGLLLEFIQLIGLVLNGNFTWGPVFGNEVAKVIYFFDFPLFDSDWASNTFGAANAFFWIFLLMLLSWILVVIHFMFQDFQRMPRWMQAYCQFVAHAVASFAVIPMGMMFMSFIVCDAGFHEMFWFNETCFGGYSIAYFIFSVIGMLALALVLYIGTSFLHDDMPDSTNLLARPNPYLCDLHAAMKLAAVICFHVLLSKGQAQAFCITLCAMAATLAVLYVYFLPYYNLRVNRFRVGEMAAVAVVAAVAIPCASSDSTWNSKSISTVVAIAGGALAFIGGWFVAGVRVNADYLKAIDTLRHHSSNAAVCIGEEDYPRRLPVDDLIFTRYPTIEKLIMGDRVREQKRKSKNPLTVRFNLSAPDGDGDEGGSHARGGRGSARHNSQDEEDEEEGRQQPHTNGSDDGSEDHELYLDRMSVLIPYITNIYASTDIELATRFLRDFREQSGSVDPTPRMCAFAGRIMTKGLVKYSSDPLLVYQFCIFLAIFGKKLRMSLAELTILQRTPRYVSASLSYHMFRLSEQLKQSLNVSNSHQIQLVSTSAEMQKEILGAMSSFWSSLASGSHTNEQLTHIADYITEKRESCKRFYSKTLLMPNEAILINYARFLRDVMLDEESAKMLRERVAEEAEMQRQQKRNQREGHNDISSSINNASRLGSNWEACRLVLRSSEKRQKQNSDDYQLLSQGADAIQRLRMLLYIIFLAIFLLVVALIIFMAVQMSITSTMVNRINAASQTRLYTAVGCVITKEVRNLGALGLSPAQQAPVVASLYGTLRSSATKLYSSHQDLMLGNLLSKSSTVADFVNQKRAELLTPGVQSLEGNYSRSLTSYFDLGFTVASEMMLAGTNEEGSDLARELLAINGDDGSFSRAMNQSVQVYVANQQNYVSNVVWVVIVIYAVSVFLLLAVYAIILVFLRRIEVSKMTTINLFFHIPRSYLEVLYRTSRDKTRYFERDEDLLEDDVGGAANNNNNGGIKSPPPSKSRRPAPESPTSAGTSTGSAAIFSGAEERAPGRDGEAARHAGSDDDDDDEETSTSANSPRQSGAASPMHAEDGKDRNMIVHEPVADSGNTIAADEVEQHSITAILGGISKSLSGTTIVMLVMVVACLFAVAAFVLAYRFHIISINLDTSTDNLMGFINRATRYFDYLTTLGTYAQQYTITGDVVHVERYHDYLAVNDYTELFQTGIAEASNAAVVSCVVNLRVLLNSAMDRQVVAMWLASSYYGMTPDDTYIFSRVNAVNHDYDYTAMASVEQTAFAPFNPVVPSPTASTNVIDGSLPVADQLQIARNLVFSDYYQDLRFLVANNLAQMVDVHDSNRDHLINEQKGVWIACIVMLGCCMLALFFSLHGFLRQRRSSLIVQVLCATCVLVAIATIIILSVAYKNAVDGNNYHDYYFTYLQCFNDTSLNLAANRFYALRMQRYGYTSTEAIWAPTAAVSTYNASLNQLEVALATSTPDPEVAKETLQVLQLARDIATLIYYSNIAADLSVNAWGLPDTPVLVGFYYNRQFELNYMMGYFMLGSNVDDYSYPVYDFALPTATQLAIAQRAISGPRYDVVSKSFSEGFSTTMQSIGNSMLGRADNSEDNVSKFGLASMIMSACLMGGIILLTMFAIYHVMMVKAAMNSPDEDSLVESADDITGPNLDMATKGNLVSLVLFLSIFSVLVLLSAILFMGLFYKSRQIQNTNLLSSIKERDWSFIEAVMDAQQVWYNSPNMSDMSPYLVDLLRSIITTLQFREDLYLGDGNTYEGLLSISQSQNKELFGSDVYAYEEYHAPCRTFIYDPGYAVLDFKNFMDGQDDDMLANLYSGGVENVVWQLLGLLINVLNQKQVETSLPYDTALFAIFPSVSRKLVNSSNSYFDDRSHNGTLIATVFIILCSVTLVLIVLLVLFVFRPLLQHLQEEEEGTRLLLRMIPENIRREVPAIHDFFQTGNVNHDAEVILEACAEVEQSAMVVLTDQDVVTRITQDALHRFQRTADEVIGKHVEVLLSEERGRVMADYRRRNGRSRLALLVGKKGNSYGRTSEGVVFPIEINVREVTLYGNSTTTNKSKCFVVVFRPVTIKQDKSVVRQIQAAIISDSDHAQLVIDARGILRSVNRSTKRMFSYKQDELLGRHLSALIAPTDDHDSDAYVQNLLNQLSYLAREDRSAQVKHRLNGITQDERVFPAEMAFATVVNDAGDVQYILIHVRDLTDDASSTKGDAMSNALIDISPIPVVVLDEDSNIVFFNKAAERSWGLTSGRVMGSTLNDLLYGADATRYDFSRHSQSDLRHFLDVSRTLDAKRSTGEQFLTEVTMRELRRGDNTLSVIAFFKDLSKEVEVSQRNALSECAFQGCPIPVVVMDERGRVEKINKAAERQFGYAAKELEGQSVNLIMPDHIAQKHDSYLERYLTTGVKKMLAGPRSVYAKRADGRLFSVEARVLEVMVDDALAGGKAQRMFIGFLRDTTEHYQMMKANELHEAVTDHCPVAMLSCNHAGRLLSLNGAAQKLFECGPTSMIGQPMEKVLPNFEEVFRFPAKKGQAPGSMDGVRPLQARTISGNLSAVEVRIREIRKGTVDALFVASVSPISVKTKLEDESNMERAFISLYPRAIIVVNTRGTLRYASDQAVQLFGYVKSTDMAGNHLTTIIPCEDAKQQDKFISSLIKNNNNNNSSSAANYTCLRKDGLTFTARIHSKRLSTDDLPTSARGLSGVASSMDSEELHVLFIHDQTYQHTLMRSDQIREAMLTTMDFGAVQINASGIIVYANNYFATIFRYGSAMEVIGKSINLIMPRNVAKEHDRYLQNYLKTGQSRVMGTSRELTGVRRDGSSIHVEVTIRDLLDPTHGRTIFGFLRDISEVFEIRNHHRLLKQLVSTSPMPALLVSYHHDVDEGVVATNTNTKTSSAMDVGAYTSSEGIIYSTNEAALTHFCYTEAELIGMSLEELRKADAGDLSPRHNLNASSTNNNNSSSSPNNNKTARSLVEMYHDAKSDQVPSFTSPTESRNPAAAAELLFPTVSTTMVALKKGGKTFPVRIIMMEMYDEDINGFALLIYVEELTHKMQEQFEQRISATVAEICPTALIGADQSGDILLFSEQAESIFGYMEKEVLGRHMSLLMTPKMAKDHARFMETYLNGPDHHLERRASTKLRQVARHKNGSLVPIEIELYESAPVLAVGGNARATAAMQRTNLAQQQQQQQQQPRVGAESALSDKRRLFIAKIRLASKDCPDAVTGALSQLTMSAIGIPFVMFSGVGVIEHANAALANLFGYAADELLSRNIKILISPHVAKKFDDYTRHLVRTAQVMDGGATAPLSNTSEDGANPTPATATSAANNTLQPPLYITAKHKTGRELRIEISVGLHCAVPSSVNRTTLYAFVRSVENSLELRREQAIHEALTDLESIAVLLINSRGIITHASARARTLFGYLGTDANAARNESNLLEGQDLRHVVPKAKDFRKFCASFEDDHGKMVELHLTGVRRDGGTIPCAARLKEVSEGGDEVTYVCLISSTARDQRTEDYTTMVGSLNKLGLLGVVVMNARSMITHVNERMLRTLHYDSASELLGKKIESIMLAKDAEVHHKYMESYLRGLKGTPFIINQTRRVVGSTREGQPILLDLSVEEHFIGPTREHIFVSYFEDLTETAKKETNEQTASLMLAMIPVASVLVDAQGVVLYASESCRSLFAVKDDLVGRSLRKYLLPQSVEVLMDGSGHLHTGELELSFVTAARTSNNEPRLLHTSTSITALAGTSISATRYLCFITPKEE